jgi:hypothetical protein
MCNGATSKLEMQGRDDVYANGCMSESRGRLGVGAPNT